MKTELKKVIIDFIFENRTDFQLHNLTTKTFREYIYNSEGNYLIGGEDVAGFIKDAIFLITDKY